MSGDEFEVVIVLEEQKGSDENWFTLHQCLLMLLDSPLNHAGNLKVFIRLLNGKLIKLHREVRIPRTFKRFEQLFCNFLQGLDMPVVQTKDGQTKLLQFVGKSIEKQIYDSNANDRYRIANLAPRLRNPEFFTEIKDQRSITLIVEFGPVDLNILGCGRDAEVEVKTFVKEHHDTNTYSISRYPLSPSLTCVKLTSAFEKALEIF